MEEVMFDFAGDYILVRVNNNRVSFSNSKYGNQMATIEGLKLDKNGVLKEWPDLKDKEDWKETAIKRFKEKIRSMQTESEVCEFIIYDLQKYGYKPLYRQKNGFRRQKL